MDVDGVYRVRQKESSFDESEDPSKHDPSLLPPPYFTMSQSDDARSSIVFWAAVAVAQLTGLAIVVLVVYYCNLAGGFAWNSDADLQFFYHPLCMVLGLIFFYGEAILVYRVLYFLPKRVLKLVHAALHVCAIVLSSVGLVAVFENHRRTDKPDMYSLHSWIGIATFGFFCLQYISGFVAFLFPGVPMSLRSQLMPFHTFFGVGVFLMAVASAHMGLTERLLWTKDFSKLVPQGVVINCIGVLLVIFAFVVVFLATHGKFKRKPLASELAPTN